MDLRIYTSVSPLHPHAAFCTYFLVHIDAIYTFDVGPSQTAAFARDDAQTVPLLIIFSDFVFLFMPRDEPAALSATSTLVLDEADLGFFHLWKGYLPWRVDCIRKVSKYGGFLEVDDRFIIVDKLGEADEILVSILASITIKMSPLAKNYKHQTPLKAFSQFPFF